MSLHSCGKLKIWSSARDASMKSSASTALLYKVCQQVRVEFRDLLIPFYLEQSAPCLWLKCNVSDLCSHCHSMHAFIHVQSPESYAKIKLFLKLLLSWYFTIATGIYLLLSTSFYFKKIITTFLYFMCMFYLPVHMYITCMPGTHGSLQIYNYRCW